MQTLSSERILEKLSILADAAKYDVSCSSSGSKRKNHNKGLGNSTGGGICHTYTEDGRCVSLLKILLTNHCIYDCAYCVSRKSNDIKRAAFTVEEVVELTLNFYKRNYIEGLFLSSGIFKNADTTMERLVAIARKLRTEHRFNGYIHLKSIPGASDALMQEAGLYADRLSVNLELPSETSLHLLAPGKTYEQIKKPMLLVSQTIQAQANEKHLLQRAAKPLFAPAGQSTQMVIGATPETDKDIMYQAHALYQNYRMKRVYYSGYIPINPTDTRLPGVGTPAPLIREHRLYQSDWLMRFYGFQVTELLSDSFPQLDSDIDPKLSWALRNLHQFPVDINTADYEAILRIPGIGVQSAQKIISARRFGQLDVYQLKKLGVAFNRARYFLVCRGMGPASLGDLQDRQIKHFILAGYRSKFSNAVSSQLSLF